MAAAKWGRNSIGFEVDSHYLKLAEDRIVHETSSLFGRTDITMMLEKQGSAVVQLGGRPV